jgi:flagellar biosynthetic protein FlhB
MAQDKTEKPTRRRLKEVRKKGQSARSGEVGSAVGLLVIFMTLPSTLSRLTGVFTEAFAQTGAIVSNPSDDAAIQLFWRVARNASLALLPMFIALAVIGSSVQFAMVGGRPNLSQLKPKPSRLNIMKGFKRFFSPYIVWEFGKTALKLGALAIVLMTSWTQIRPVLRGEPVGVGVLATEIGGAARLMFVRVAMLAVLIGIIDAVVARRRFRKASRMTKQEVREEMRQSEGDPHAKGEVRRRMMRLSRSRMMSDVPKATMVLTNPTHLAIALRYTDSDPAPVVLAKGKGVVAQRIRETAAEHGIPVLERKPLARALYPVAEIGQSIPVAFYQAIAEVLAIVWRAKRTAA